MGHDQWKRDLWRFVALVGGAVMVGGLAMHSLQWARLRRAPRGLAQEEDEPMIGI